MRRRTRSSSVYTPCHLIRISTVCFYIFLYWLRHFWSGCYKCISRSGFLRRFDKWITSSEISFIQKIGNWFQRFKKIICLRTEINYTFIFIKTYTQEIKEHRLNFEEDFNFPVARFPRIPLSIIMTNPFLQHSIQINVYCNSKGCLTDIDCFWSTRSQDTSKHVTPCFFLPWACFS